MLHHIVMFRFAADTPEEQRRTAVQELRLLKDKIPEIRQLTVELDTGNNPGNFDMVLEADFASHADYMRYVPHDAHQRAWGDHVQPITADLASAQFETEDR
jgi:hypothetical protein